MSRTLIDAMATIGPKQFSMLFEAFQIHSSAYQREIERTKQVSITTPVTNKVDLLMR